MQLNNDPIELFKLRPVKAAKVSEISEATAASSVPPEERVNFHIGNPIQDNELYSAYLRMILGIDITSDIYNVKDIDKIIDDLSYDSTDKDKFEFFVEMIKKAAPYTPRGGFIKTNPGYIVNYFNDWLLKNQQEPLSYDLGEKSGKREIILCSGGLYETLRVFFHTLSYFMIHKPVNILSYGITIPDHLKNFDSLKFFPLDESEKVFIEQLVTILKNNSASPSFLLLGKNTKEETRRKLRVLCLEYPIFFVEVNDAPNHLSLAREAKMMNRVIRFITPAAFSDSLNNLSIVFAAGNADFIKVIETIHFQLKGTPSSTEILLLDYLLKNISSLGKKENLKEKIKVDPEYESMITNIGFNTLSGLVKNFENKFNSIIESEGKLINNLFTNIESKKETFIKKAERFSSGFQFDRFTGNSPIELLNSFLLNISDQTIYKDISDSFLSSFLNYHHEYDIKKSLVVSGSSRTALSLLGFHCGIEDVIFPDLSWTYQHCFPKVNVVPLTDDFQLDVDLMIKSVKEKLAMDSEWKNKGAVALNNPHNATGQLFDEEDLRKLIKWLLDKNIYIIDDLSYQNVVPENQFRIIKTIRQISDDLSSEGYITTEQAEKVITVHSMSKTDSFAGARLSVIEIREKNLFDKFSKVNSFVQHNIGAVFLAYLFYRNRIETINAYYLMRNKIFFKRSKAINDASANLPLERNQFNISIKPPKGSMYPQMIINDLPSGLSLDWLASGLASQGIGLVPLSAFARTEKGFETGRKTFRLTLGGTDNDEVLSRKTRRVLIDLNRLIAEEAANYNRIEFRIKQINVKKKFRIIDNSEKWNSVEKILQTDLDDLIKEYSFSINEHNRSSSGNFSSAKEFIVERISVFRNRFIDRQNNLNDNLNLIISNKGKNLKDQLEREFYKDDLFKREDIFRNRLFDRTVHPTQMYSIKSELLFESIIDALLKNKNPDYSILKKLRSELIKEYYGRNVAIVSNEEPSELILDLNSLIAAEDFINLHSGSIYTNLLSFWGDWDGSNRPSGQGHSLVASVVIENVRRQAAILNSLLKIEKSVKIESELLSELEKLPLNIQKFSELLNEITLLTHQLEKRYKGILPFNVQPGKLRRLGMKLHVAQDPLTKLWHHNDRLERKMLELRKKRRDTLEYYFSLNKQLRKTLHGLIPTIQRNINSTELLLEASSFRNLLSRFVVTPRIHQKLITAQDQFAIDTTVHNINEINEISGKYGNPGMVLALQISMTTKPEALISVDRKMKSKREHILRDNKNIDLPNVWIVPLFEDIDSVKNIDNYLNKVWEYSLQSRKINQSTEHRFSEIICEIFVAGSDLSQQVGQANGMDLYKRAKYTLTTWSADHDLIGKIRMKMGSGEPMQRQGGYYSPVAGKPAFDTNEYSSRIFSKYLAESTKRSTRYATTPLIGIFSGGDLRTVQSNLAEKMRLLSVADLSQLIFHMKEAQHFYEKEILRAGEPLAETRLQFKTRGLQELERLTIGKQDRLFEEFLKLHTENFRQIVYGREEDVVGLHIISYFIGRTTPPLRDRPTVRPGQGNNEGAGQKILEKIAGTIPFAKYGSLLRAISHNQSQTVVLGINQLSTGLFRALNNFSQKVFIEEDTSSNKIEKILPHLPVYEILHTLRIYHDKDLKYLGIIEKAFTAGNSALLALREDVDSMGTIISYFKKELLRRHGLNVNEFFDGDKFITDLLPTLRADLAVLLQPDLFNTDIDLLVSKISGHIDSKWLLKMRTILSVRDQVDFWREKIWKLLQEPVYQRVAGFVELANALYSISSNTAFKEYLFSPAKIKLSDKKINFSGPAFDDNMQQFLTASMDYLSSLSREMVEVPINIIRALKEVERIIKIEEQALFAKDQDRLRFYLLQIARITGENG